VGYNIIGKMYMLSSVYALKDPRDLSVRYIGITKQNPQSRLMHHIYENGRCHRCCWIKSLKVLGLQPIIETQEDGIKDEDRDIYEKIWILAWRIVGADLTNGTAGGEGSNILTEEVRERMRSSHLGKQGHPHSQEAKEKIRKYHIGKTHSAESKEKMRMARAKIVFFIN
jgi:hypothetical protein